MSCDVGEVTEKLENELCCISICMSSAHSPTFPSLALRHNSFSNPSVTLRTSQLVLQPFRCFTYITFILEPFFRFSYVRSSSLRLIHPASRPCHISPLIILDIYVIKYTVQNTSSKLRFHQIAFFEDFVLFLRELVKSSLKLKNYKIVSVYSLLNSLKLLQRRMIKVLTKIL